MPATLSNALETSKSQISYWEKLDGYQEFWEEENNHVVRRLGCLWSERFDFCKEMLGSVSGILGTLSRTLPEEDLESSNYWATGMRLTSGSGYPGRDDDYGGTLRVMDREQSSGSDTDGIAWYDVKFEKPRYQVLSDEEADADDLLEMSRYVIREREFNAEALPLPSRFLEWELAPRLPIPQAAVMTLPKGVYYYTWKMIPRDAYDEETVNATMGKVNDTTFDGFAEPETMLFLGPKIREYQHANGQLVLDVTYVFEYRKQTHNKFLRADRNSEPIFEYVRRRLLNTKRVFEKADFLTNLFTVV